MTTPQTIQRGLLPHAPAIDPAPEVTTYTRFVASFEPYEFSGWVDESVSWKETCYIGDWSPLFKLRVRGRDAIPFFAQAAVNSFARFDVGQAKHAVLCNEAGNVMGEGILMRHADDEVELISGPGVLWARYLFDQGDWDAVAEDVTDRGFIFQVQGPRSLELLEQATGESLRDIGFLRFRTASIDGMPVTFLRQGMAGEVGFELQGPIEHGPAVYRRIVELGQAVGIRRLGARTKMVNHVEACFPTPSVDFIAAWVGGGGDPLELAFAEQMRRDNPGYVVRQGTTGGSYVHDDVRELHRNPVELGWGKSIRFDHDFRGRAALEVALADPRRAMVTLVWDSGDVLDVLATLFRRGEELYDFMEFPRHGLAKMMADRVEIDGELVGVTTSRCYSVWFREMISLCTIDVGHAEPGTRVEVVWGTPGTRQKRIGATVAPAPYKRDNRRVDLAALSGTTGR